MPHKPGCSGGQPPRETASARTAARATRQRPGRRPPAGPTAHLPGSPGKLAVLAERARLGLPLFHPGDAGGPLLRGVRVVARFRAAVTLGGVRKELGCYRTAAAAAAAVREARMAHGLADADAALAAGGWSVEEEAGCECEGGGCRCA